MDDCAAIRSSLHSVAERAADYLESLESRPVGARAGAAEVRRALDRALPDAGEPSDAVVERLAAAVEPGLVASAGPRFFGFVVGGALRAGLMADWLTAAWDQNAQVHATSPAAAAVEDVVARWVLELLGLPATCSVGLGTGTQAAHVVALACARRTLLERAGWDADAHGLFGAPPIDVFMSACGHATVRSALQLLGFGIAQVHEVEADAEGRMRLPALEEGLRRTALESGARHAAGTPVIVSVQAGNVNTGAFEPIDEVAGLLEGRNAWLHVDGAFGLWAAASPALRSAVRGIERADSWATDAHKWLNVPYDSGLVIVRDAAAHRRLKPARCAYAGEESDGCRDGSTWVLENSRRARSFALYAALAELGRHGVRDLVERSCALARRFADGVRRTGLGAVVNEVALNQVLVALDAPAGSDDARDAFHRAVGARLQADGACWIGTTEWNGRTILRVSFSNWRTTDGDVDVALEALARAVSAPSPPPARPRASGGA